MHDLTGFQRDLLYVAASLNEPSGSDIRAVVGAYYGEEIAAGRLYPNLNELVEKGLIEKGRVNDRTNKYVVTHRGKREIDARQEWIDGLVLPEWVASDG